MSKAFTFRLGWAVGHFAVSAAVVGTIMLTTLCLWYPPPLASLQGLGTILVLLAVVDLSLGPLCTLLIASPKKRPAHIARDVALIGLVQAAALAYGVHTVWIARPAYIVFNKDRFDVVSASELEHEYFGGRTAGEFASPPIGRARWVHAVPPSSLDERNKLLLQATTGGPDLRHYPSLYHQWPKDTEGVRARLKPLEKLSTLSAENAAAVAEVVVNSGLPQDRLAYLPLVGRSRIGVVVVKRDDLSVIETLDITPDY